MKVDADSIKVPHRRLVIFEGIMGSGKSSSTRWLGQRLAARGIDASIQIERQYPHPLRATDFAAEWFKPWLDMTAEDLASRRLGLWATFAGSALASQTVHVVDGQLFHGDLTNMFLMNMPPEAIAQNLQAVAEVIRPLRPLLVYYYQSDVDRAIRLTAAERGEELGVRYQVDWKLKYAYAVERGLEGLDGLSSLYTDYRGLTDRLFAQLTIDKIAIENSARDWPAYYARIEDALGF
jgi:broad specificity phosphatase PhoE